ncbi:flagellar MS-ring protein [Rubripirellula lacrimiformis]|uniref:Flagellar MS-ring protein n=1 Tax=Rubripirellula lacrimiformis TaxID=1930273 RepID=A0A517N6H1_9BACT|nr:beta-cystathionase [Rubripirellula lacrimiformis]QDT02739.1 flagellar MS-ring protein [Rubripirellula lacrimiformis]
MNFLKQSTDQARQVFASMPVQSRVITGMLVVAIAIGLAFLVRGDATAGREYLFGGKVFSDQELAAMEMSFSRAGLNDWKRDGTRMMIPASSKDIYVAAMGESTTLPMSLNTHVQEAIKATTVFDSSELHNARFDAGREMDLSRSIASMADIKAATVVHDRGERQGLGREISQTASVFIQPEGTAPLSKHRRMAIQELVKGAYAGMKVEDVVVTDANDLSGSSIADDDDPVLRKKREYESETEKKVRNLLIGFPAQIAVSAEVDPTMDVEKTTLKYDAEPTNLSNKQRKIETTNTKQPPQGVPGAQPNAIGNRSASLADNVETMKSKEDERETRGVAGQQYENSRVASLQITRVRVSIGLPRSYYVALHTQKFLAKEPDKTIDDVPPMDETTYETLKSETTTKIQSAVAPLLPEVSAGADRFPLVEVFDYYDLPGPPAIEPDTTKIALAWLAESWQTIALVFLGLAALLVARSAASGAADSTPPEFREGFGLDLPAPAPEVETPKDDPDTMTITGGSLKDELLQLVEGNPEVAANVIRGWVGEAA